MLPPPPPPPWDDDEAVKQEDGGGELAPRLLLLCMLLLLVSVGLWSRRGGEPTNAGSLPNGDRCDSGGETGRNGASTMRRPCIKQRHTLNEIAEADAKKDEQKAQKTGRGCEGEGTGRWGRGGKNREGKKAGREGGRAGGK